MTKLRPLLCLILLFFGTVACQTVRAQAIPSDLTNVHVDDLSDAQIRQLLLQASSSGLTVSQIVYAAENRGLPQAEADKLRKRIDSLQQSNNDNPTPYSAADTAKRRLNYRPDTDSAANRYIEKKDMFTKLVPKVFGSDIFRNGSLSFSPDLKIATPQNYMIGPGDQLNISIYGNSLANWKLEVSPEGNINMPAVGLLNVAGRTIEQATSVIKSKLAANRYAIGRGTSVQVNLGNIRSIKVTMIGQLNKPGSYTMPSLATAFNALYAAGGPNDNGSFRQIEIIRNSKIIRTLDIYDFLTRGDQRNNITLQDQDIIRVPSYRMHVEMAGEIKSPAIFEVLPGETLDDILKFAGGFTDQAFTGRITVYQVSDRQRRITDVAEADFKNYIPLRGDRYVIGKVLDRFENRVTIKGAVFRPGQYELDKGLTISGLIAKAAGVKEDAFTTRASIVRLNSDNTRQIISFNVKSVLNKTAPDIPLRREDSVYIASIFELRDKYSVTIKGNVRKPGTYAFADSINLADLIIKAGGFMEGASAQRIEIGRRITNSDPNSLSGKVATVYNVDVDARLGFTSGNFVLQPYDMVSVYSLPGFEKQRTIKVEGEVLYPGYYTLENKNEKISDIVKRAGNLTASADIEGASLKRTNDAILGIDKNKADSAAMMREQADRMRHLQHSFRDSTVTDSLQQPRNNYIGINLQEILKKPGSSSDLLLEDGDVLRVPKQQQVVRVNGEVLYPSAVVFEKGKSFSDYISNAGGYATNALRRGAYIVYANGTVKGSGKFLFFNSHPQVKPGSEIFVPKKPVPHGNTLQTLLGLTTGLASIGAIILGIISIRR